MHLGETIAAINYETLVNNGAVCEFRHERNILYSSTEHNISPCLVFKHRLIFVLSKHIFASSVTELPPLIAAIHSHKFLAKSILSRFL